MKKGKTIKLEGSKNIKEVIQDPAKPIDIECPAKRKAKERYKAELQEIDRPKTAEDEYKRVMQVCGKVYNNPDLSYLTTDNLHTWIVGGTNSGKTNLGMNLLLHWKRNPKTTFDKIYIICPTEVDRIRSGQERCNWSHFTNPNVFYSRPNEELWEKIKENNENGLKTVVVYDDVTQYVPELRNPDSLATMIATMGRHKDCRVVMLVHNMCQCGTLFRDNMGDLFITKMPQPRYHDMVCDMIENCQLPKKKKMEIFSRFMDGKKNAWNLAHIPLINQKQDYPFLFFKPSLVKK